MKNFNQIYKDFHLMVLSYYNSKLNNLELSEELTNDVFLKVYNNLDKYDSEKSKVITWVMFISKNTLIDYYRRKRLKTISINKDIEQNENLSIIHLIKNSDNQMNDMISNESLLLIRNTISSLDEKYRVIADLYFNKELTYKEITVLLKIPMGSVKGMINRSRNMLKDKLKTIYYEVS